jgi:hypothetical protein
VKKPVSKFAFQFSTCSATPRLARREAVGEAHDGQGCGGGRQVRQIKTACQVKKIQRKEQKATTFYPRHTKTKSF